MTPAPETPQQRLARMLRVQSSACADLGSPLYAALMDRAADDVLTGGPVAVVLAGHEQDPGPSALALRLFGAVHRLVLDGRAPELAPYYPSVGGTPDIGAAWVALSRVLVEQRDAVRAGLRRAPQTNEVGRSAALFGGLLHVVDEARLPVRLHEIGASAGLNLRATHVRYVAADGTAFGPRDSPVELRPAWSGTLPPLGSAPEVLVRRGSDVDPIDATTRDGQIVLTSYVWPDQVERLTRLRGAFRLAERLPAVVEHAGALDAVRRLELAAGTWTVLWHSVMWQYIDPADRDRIDARLAELGAQTAPVTRLAHLRFEPVRRAPGRAHEFLVVLTTWPGRRERILGSAPPHGLPVTWE